MSASDHHLIMADRLAAITQRIGFTLWQLQELEGVAAQYFVLLTQAKKGMGVEAGNALVEKAKAKTFGATVRQIAKSGLLTQELERRIIHLLAERNWLVHQSRASSRGAVHNDGAMSKLIYRLDAMADEAISLLSALGVLIDRFAKQQGVSESKVKEEVAKTLAQWRDEDAT
jgi:hypothetical protein